MNDDDTYRLRNELWHTLAVGLAVAVFGVLGMGCFDSDQPPDTTRGHECEPALEPEPCECEPPPPDLPEPDMVLCMEVGTAVCQLEHVAELIDGECPDGSIDACAWSP